MADQFLIVAPLVRAAGTDVPPEQIQAALNAIARQCTIALNSLVGEPEPPSGPAGGDLSGTYPNPTVANVNGVAAGTMANQNANAVAITGGTIAGLSSALGVTSGGTGQNALSAHNVLIGEGTSAVGFAAPGASGNILSSTGAAADPAFQTPSTLGLAQVSGTTFTGAVNLGYSSPVFTLNDTSGSNAAYINFSKSGAEEWSIHANSAGGLYIDRYVSGTYADTPFSISSTNGTVGMGDGIVNSPISGSTGSFTTLAASSTVSGAGFTTLLSPYAPLASPTFTGTVSAAAITASSTITPSQTAGIVGTTTTNNANAGSVGEYVTATGTAVSLANNTPANITSVSLTAGDWDVTGSCQFIPAGTTTINALNLGINNTSVTLPAPPLDAQIQAALTTGSGQAIVAPTQRYSLSSTTTIYLVAQSGFGVSTMNATGMIRARRIR